MNRMSYLRLSGFLSFLISNLQSFHMHISENVNMGGLAKNSVDMDANSDNLGGRLMVFELERVGFLGAFWRWNRVKNNIRK